MTYYIFGRVKNKVVWFVGCSRTADIPEGSILLQSVQHHPDVHWVKWSLRLVSTLGDKTALSHPYAKYFKNSARTKRLFGDPDIDRFAEEQNARFLKFHKNNPHLLEELLKAALGKKADGKIEYSMDQLLGDARWGDTEIDRSDGRGKHPPHRSVRIGRRQLSNAPRLCSQSRVNCWNRLRLDTSLNGPR